MRVYFGTLDLIIQHFWDLACGVTKIKGASPGSPFPAFKPPHLGCSSVGPPRHLAASHAGPGSVASTVPERGLMFPSLSCSQNMC